MTEKRCLKSKFSIMKVFGILFLLLMSTITVQAAANPLAKMPTKDGKVLHKVGDLTEMIFLRRSILPKLLLVPKVLIRKLQGSKRTPINMKRIIMQAIKLRRYLREQLKLR